MVSIEKELHKLERTWNSQGAKDDRFHSRNRSKLKTQTRKTKKK